MHSGPEESDPIDYRTVPSSSKDLSLGQWEWLAIVALIAAIASAVFAFRLVAQQNPEHRFQQRELTFFRSLAANPPACLEFERDGQTFRVDDRTDIVEFFVLFSDAKPVPPHHSHPRDAWRMTLSNSSRVYYLARDSSIQGETWLLAEQTERQGIENARRVKQVRSSTIVDWCRRVGLEE